MPLAVSAFELPEITPEKVRVVLESTKMLPPLEPRAILRLELVVKLVVVSSVPPLRVSPAVVAPKLFSAPMTRFPAATVIAPVKVAELFPVSARLEAHNFVKLPDPFNVP